MNASKARIFVSYSHRGNGPEWKSRLLRHLAVFEQQYLFDVWQDGNIRVSSYWDDDIRGALNGAQVAIVLLTPEALESEYILDVEFPALRDRQRRDRLPVFPVICEECDWRRYDWLRGTQAPNASNPLSQLTEAQQERVLRQLATAIAQKLSAVALAELPSPDQPLELDRVYLDRFPRPAFGLCEEKLLGREQELALLDLAFAQPHTAIVSLVAWGGVGKTMLVQHWLQCLQHEGRFGAQRVYAWSFYSQGTKEDRQASEDSFLAHALEWFGVECEPTLSPWDKGRLLTEAVMREPTLLILDGIEPLQYPPGPMGGQFRAPGVQSLLKHVARKANDNENCGLCLVTTREPLTDLADFQRRPGAAWGSVLRVDLSSLTEEAGAALLHHAGANRAGAAEIKPDDSELLAASRQVDGHALTLNLLGRFLSRAHGGDIRRRDLVKFEEADRKEQGGTTFKMLAAFENLFDRGGQIYKQQLSILRILGLFDRTTDEGCIDAVRKPPVIPELTDPLFRMQPGILSWGRHWEQLPEEDWNAALSFLSDFRLVTIQSDLTHQEYMFDCHPLIREYFARQLRDHHPEAWSAAHRRIFEHLCEITKEGDHPALEDLQPLYQSVAHGCQAGMKQEALCKVYRDRILRGDERYSVHRLGAFGSDLGAIACFFDVPWSRVSADAEKGWLLNAAGFHLHALGRVKEATEPMRAALEMRLDEGLWSNAARVASNLSEVEQTLGKVAEAVRVSKQSVTYADRSGEAFVRLGNRATYADALHQAGHRVEAEKSFIEAEALQALRMPDYPLLFGLAGFHYCELLLTVHERTAWQFILGSPFGSLPSVPTEFCHAVTLRAEKTLQWAQTSHTTTCFDRLTLSRVALYEAVFTQSEIRDRASEMEATIKDLRSAGRSQYLPLGLVTRVCYSVALAKAHKLQNRMNMAAECLRTAMEDLDEAWDFAERGPMRLHMADIHLYRARLFFREQKYPWKSPGDDLAAAEGLINECGYHRRDEELADAKRAIFGN